MSVENNNYTINSVQYTITENSVIVDTLDQNYIELTIVPNNGYTVTASNFSLATPANATYVTSVVFTQSGSNVLVTINLVTTALMPSDNLDLGVCISGSAQLSELLISGIYNTNVEPETTPASETGITYDGTGDQGDLITLFTKTFTANSGFYLTFTNVTVTQGNAGNYSFEEVPTYNSEGYMTSTTYTVKYLFPSQSISNDVIDFTLRDKALPVVQPDVVTSYTELPSYIAPGGQDVVWTLFGQPGAEYSATMTDGTQTVTIATNQAISTNGQYTDLIEFPEYTGTTYATWTITLSGDLQNPFSQPTSIVVYQYAPIEITVTADSSNSNITYTPYPTGNFQTAGTFSVNALDPTGASASLGGTINISSGSISFIDEPHFAIFSEEAYNPEAIVNGGVSNSSTVTLQNIEEGPIEVGSRFFTGPPYVPGNQNVGINSGYAVQQHEVTNVSGNTITVTPNITIADQEGLEFYKTNGNILSNNPLLDIQQISTSEITVNFDFALATTGDKDTTFTLELDNFINVSTLGQSLSLCYATTQDDLCCGLSTPVTVFVASGETFNSAAMFYTDSTLQTPSPNGFYSENATCAIP